MNLDNAVCISLWQPWASAVALGLKRYETRSWGTKHRGPLLIHASKRWTSEQRWLRAEITGKAKMLLGCAYPGLYELETEKLPLGCVVAVAELVDCGPTPPGWLLPVSGLTELERLFGDFTPGRYAWDLANVIRLPRPVPCNGHQGPWRPSAEVLAAVRGQMREAAC